CTSFLSSWGDYW
nr:immunoglobulin heavy chain junction region [Macaca mulatta]MOV86655.1 immunoglobulin heavy chain junction region [Macaca mulatta]MOV86879.1 immunoglobulin heavy chain junction region [Macaca mulatta]MOV87694.1 immunoglobulin heavy chain junction region [Macaca mulatta]MOV87950.1 immunoglobulin heavy chain junction region [Macaca mulatta]